jgi:hypothetical protein
MNHFLGKIFHFTDYRWGNNWSLPWWYACWMGIASVRFHLFTGRESPPRGMVRILEKYLRLTMLYNRHEI